MITDGEFSALITEAAEQFRADGRRCHLGAARVEIDPHRSLHRSPGRRHPRGFAISALGAAACSPS